MTAIHPPPTAVFGLFSTPVRRAAAAVCFSLVIASAVVLPQIVKGAPGLRAQPSPFSDGPLGAEAPPGWML